MSRKKRVWYPGSTYHVMSRGNRTETEKTVTTEVLTTEDLSNVYLEHLDPCYLPGDVQMQEIEE